MRSTTGEDQSVAHGGITYAEAEARSQQSLHELLSMSMCVADSDVSLDDLQWLHEHPEADQAAINAHVAEVFESGQRKPKDGTF